MVKIYIVFCEGDNYGTMSIDSVWTEKTVAFARVDALESDVNSFWVAELPIGEIFKNRNGVVERKDVWDMIVGRY